MFLEYLGLTGMGDMAFSLEFITRVLVLIVAALALVLTGFKIKGVWGAALALAAGVLFFLHSEGLIGF
jgi:hypothetical protein